MNGIWNAYPPIDSRSPRLTAEMLVRAAERIEAARPELSTLIIPGPGAFAGSSQKKRRSRRIRLEHGGILELPDGSSPIIYLLTGGRQWR